MGRRHGTTVPFEREELERLAEATSNTADYRPTSRLSRDELLGLVARSAGPQDRVHEPVAAIPAAAAVPSSPEPEPVPEQPEVLPIAPVSHEPIVERRPRDAFRPLTAPESLLDMRPPQADAIVRPVAPRRDVPVLLSLALVATAVIALLLFVL